MIHGFRFKRWQSPVVNKPISLCEVHIISTQFWLIGVYHVSIRSFIVGFCSCLCEILFGILNPTVDYMEKTNQTMDSEADIALGNASIDTVLVDCCF
jgi:hypothetical protein